MIGKPEWFTYRVFGWGIAPKTWQGWVYVIVAAAIIGGTFAATVNTALAGWAFGILIGLFLLDVLHIMMQLPQHHDERENMHQLIVERNCSFAAIVALIGIALYQTYANRALAQAGATNVSVDPWILVVLGAMLLVKIGSTVYVKWKM